MTLLVAENLQKHFPAEDGSGVGFRQFKRFDCFDSALGSGHIACKRYRWVLHDADNVAILFQDLIDALPTRAIHKTIVY